MMNKRKFVKQVFVFIICSVVLIVIVNQVRLYNINLAVEQGINAYDKGDYDLAIINYTHAINLNLWDRENKNYNLFRRGLAYYGKEDYTHALEDFSKVIELMPDDSPSLFWRGRAYYEKKDYTHALEDFSEAIELMPDYDIYYTWRARTYKKMGKYKLAIADFSKSIELDEVDDWDKYLERADVYYSTYEYALEIADYDQAISTLDKCINSGDITASRRDELKKKRNDVISSKKRTQRWIEWNKKNKGDRIAWEILDIFSNHD